MPDVPFDPVAVRAVYERQWALLAPVTDDLRLAANGPGPLVADDWRGPAADAAEQFLGELRAGLTRAADEIDAEARWIRHRILELP